MFTYTHPTSRKPLVGILLGEGARLRRDDHYDSSDGSWADCPSPGAKLEENAGAIWVRPLTLSENAHMLLRYLTQRETLLYIAVHPLTAKLVFVERPDFGRDPRVEISTSLVQHPECAAELVDCGLLAESQHAARGTEERNTIFALTRAGTLQGKAVAS